MGFWGISLVVTWVGDLMGRLNCLGVVKNIEATMVVLN